MISLLHNTSNIYSRNTVWCAFVCVCVCAGGGGGGGVIFIIFELVRYAKKLDYENM